MNTGLTKGPLTELACHSTSGAGRGTARGAPLPRPVRKFTVRVHRLQTLVELGSLSPRASAFLDASVRAGLNILVAGGTQTGTTTMLNCLAAAIPGGDQVWSARRSSTTPRAVSRLAATATIASPHSGRPAIAASAKISKRTSRRKSNRTSVSRPTAWM